MWFTFFLGVLSVALSLGLLEHLVADQLEKERRNATVLRFTISKTVNHTGPANTLLGHFHISACVGLLQRRQMRRHVHIELGFQESDTKVRIGHVFAVECDVRELSFRGSSHRKIVLESRKKKMKKILNLELELIKLVLLGI